MVGTAQEWRAQAFPSGTHIVTDGSAGPWPWLWVLVINPADIEDDADRFAACEDLARFLNGGPRPAWLEDMERPDEETVVGADGSCIEATGPMYDANPPNLMWFQREDDEAKDARARLIDRLWLTRE